MYAGLYACGVPFGVALRVSVELLNPRVTVPPLAEPQPMYVVYYTRGFVRIRYSEAFSLLWGRAARPSFDFSALDCLAVIAGWMTLVGM